MKKRLVGWGSSLLLACTSQCIFDGPKVEGGLSIAGRVRVEPSTQDPWPLGPKFWIQGPGFWDRGLEGTGFWVLGSGSWVGGHTVF